MQIIIVLTALLCAPIFVHAAPPEGGPTPAEGYILVKPRAGLSDSRLNEILARSGGAAVGIERRLGTLKVKKVRVPPGREKEFAATFSQQSEFEFAEPDYLIAPDEVVVNDPRYDNQWHLPVIGAPSAWLQSQGSGVIVAILDTGVNAEHPDLSANVLPGRNVVSNNTNSADIMGHGTAVAGTVSAVGNNGIGIASVAYGAKILPVRISDRADGVASYSAMAAGIIWAADNGARVANLSYGAGSSSTVQSAARYMRNLGGLVFVSAGNEGSDIGTVNQPDLWVVSATDRSDNLAGFSNYGSFVDFAAPGDYIYTTTRDNGYSNWRGTSFSSPVASAVAALVISARPDLNAGSIVDILTDSAVDKDVPGWDPYYGAGRVDAGDAIVRASTAQAGDSVPPSAIITNPQNGTVAGGVMDVDVLADDNDTVVAVDLKVNDILIATDFDPPYAFTWNSSGYSIGEHQLVAHARDAAGNVGESDAVTVNITNADGVGPDITISSPQNGDAISGTVSIKAYASDDSGVQQIVVTAGGKTICAGAPSVSCGWNTRKLADGEYSISAKATDNAGNISTASVSVTKSGGTTKGGKGGGGGGGNGRGKPR